MQGNTISNIKLINSLPLIFPSLKMGWKVRAPAPSSAYPTPVVRRFSERDLFD